MHLLYLHQYFVSPSEGGGTRSFEMARRLVRAGHKVTLITSNAFLTDDYANTESGRFVESEGITLCVVHAPYSNKMPFYRRILAFAQFAIKSMIEIARLRNVDLVFATSTPLTIAIPGIFGRIFHRCPMIFEVRDLWPDIPISIGALKNPLLKKFAFGLEKIAYRNSHEVIVLSQGMAEGVASKGVPENKIHVVPNSCDFELFDRSIETVEASCSQLSEFEDKALVVYCGTLGRINGAGYLVDIAAEALNFNKEIAFVIYGDGIEKEMVLQRAKQMGVLGKNFWIFPPVPKKEIPVVFSAACLTLSLVIDNPILWHNSANKFFDSLAAGKPIAINYKGWQKDLLEKTGAGFYLPPDSPTEAFRLIHDFVEDKARVKNSGEAARRLGASDFSRDQLFEKMLAVFERTVKA